MKLNTIHNQDCLEGMKQLPDNCIDLMLTSPPFKDEDVQGDYWEFYAAFMSQALRITKKAAVIIHTPSADKMNRIIAQWPPFRTLIWYKGVSLRHCRYNPMYVYRLGEYNPNGLIWSDVHGCISLHGKEKEHEYQDPVQLYSRLISMLNRKKDFETVVDPFMGSGATAVAAIQNGLDYVGYEINSEHVTLANKRISAVQLKFA